MDDSVTTINNNSINQSPSSSPDVSDDFVFVPKNIPEEETIKNKPIRVTQQTNASPPRPSSLPISEPKPIPSPMSKMNQQQNNFVSKTLISSNA